MDAGIHDLPSLFDRPISYRIPVFQRPYAWNQEDQWEPLWLDVKGIASRLLSSNSKKSIPPHFMGAIVLQFQTATSGEVVKQIVVDGQQRLTTLQLLLKAAQESFRSINDVQSANELESLTQNRIKDQGGDPDNQTKVRQSNITDLQSFQDVIRGVSDLTNPIRSISTSYKYFRDSIGDWLNEKPACRNERVNALKTTLTEYLQLATVDLDDREKPHFIFTILNARAEPLKESDHIKNTIMYEANIIDDAAKADELWGSFDRNEWWRNTTKEGRLTRIHLDRFLNYWLVMTLGREVSADRVSSEFNKYIDSSRPPIESIAMSIRKAGQIYQDMEEARQPGIEMFLRRMKTLELGVVMPPLLWLYTNDISDEKRKRSVSALESYLVRRMVCGYGSQGLNRLFVELLARLQRTEMQAVDQAIIDHLASHHVDNRIWPRNALVSESLVGVPLRGAARRQVMVLEAIELHLRSSMSEGIGHEPLTLEHILPQTWQKNWPLPEDATNSQDAESAREQAIKEIGNLTLTSGRLNQSLSNSAWREKRNILKQHTSLRINWELLEDPPEVWNEDAIHRRSEQLASIVTEIWPFADKL